MKLKYPIINLTLCTQLDTFVKNYLMPTIDSFNGIKINVYNGEHRPLHIHASYNEFEVLIVIETKDIYAGELPNKQLRSVFDWSSVNSDWALKVFYELTPNLQ